MVQERVQRRLAAILAADVVGYSRLMEADEAGTVARLKTLREEVFEPITARGGGRIFKTTGDGALVEFQSAFDALQCAVEVQRELAARNAELPEDRQIALRIGISLGDVIVEGDDLYGNGVNVAARLEAIAEPGGICVSGNVHEHVRTMSEIHFEDLGEVEVKNISRPARVYRARRQSGETTARTGEEGTPPLPDKPSIAVLPFQNLSGDPEQEYFADGIAEDVLTALSRFHWFFVIARNSSFTYKGRAVDVKQVARELGVQYVLEGSVRKAGDRLRITAQLIDAVSGPHVWAERYDRTLGDIFEIQDQITQSIVGSVAPEFVGAEMRRARRTATPSLRAWDLAARAHWHIARFTKDDNNRAKDLLRQAIDLDPTGSFAFSDLALCHMMAAVYGWNEDRERSLEDAASAAYKAVQLDDHDAYGQTMLGFADLWRNRHEEAIRRLEAAIELNPNLSVAHACLGQTLAFAGEPERSIAHTKTAIRLSPREPYISTYYIALAVAAFVAGRYEDTIDWAKKVIQENPLQPSGHRLAAVGYSLSGRVQEARAHVSELLQLMPGLTISGVRAAVPYRCPDDRERYLDALRKAGLPE